MKLRFLSAFTWFLFSFATLFFMDSSCEFIADQYLSKPLPPLFWFCDAFAPDGILHFIIPALIGSIAWLNPIKNLSIHILVFLGFIALLTCGLILGMHTSANGHREVTAGRYFVNYLSLGILFLIIFWNRIRPNKLVQPTSLRSAADE